MKLRLQYLEGMVSRLEREKKGMEEEFGRQRKKFMNEMIQSEGSYTIVVIPKLFYVHQPF